LEVNKEEEEDRPYSRKQAGQKEFFIIIEMIRWTSLASWEFEFPLPGSLTSTFLCRLDAINEELQSQTQHHKTMPKHMKVATPETRNPKTGTATRYPI